FERSLLLMLKEIQPADILPAGDNDQSARITALGEELKEIRRNREAVQADIAKRYSPAMANVLHLIEEREAEVDRDLQAAWQSQATPVSEAWKEVKGLLEALEVSPDPVETRLRLRAVIGQIIDSIYLLVVPKGRARFCRVRVQFKDTGKEGHRSYILTY